MSSSLTRQPSPGPSVVHNSPGPTTKRSSPDVSSEAEDHIVKKARRDVPVKTTKTDKKRQRRKKRKIPVVVGIGSKSSRTPISITSGSVSASGVGRSSNPIQETRQSQSELPPATSTDAKPDDTITPIAPDARSNEIEKLNVDVATKAALIRAHENAMSQVQQNITCQICLDLLYKPYALAPCGHIACYSCLVSWFSRPTGEGADQLPVYRRKKSCPHCRTTIRDVPVEVWAIKNMVNSLMNTGLLVGLPPPPEPVSNSSGGGQASSGADASREDPWKDIFRSHNSLSFPRDNIGIRDEEDGGVYRCVDCMHEIVDGACTHCHRIYPAHIELDLDDDFSDDDVRFLHMDLHDPIDDNNSEIEEEEDHFMAQTFFRIAAGLPMFPTYNDLNPDDEDDESDSMAGFIDDDVEIQEMGQEDAGSRIEEIDNVDLDHNGVAAVEALHGPSEVIEVSDDEDESLHRPTRHRAVSRAQTTINLLSDDEEGDEDEDETRPFDDSEADGDVAGEGDEEDRDRSFSEDSEADNEMYARDSGIFLGNDDLEDDYDTNPTFAYGDTNSDYGDY
ncbi:hypothetical protein EV361DRAFT_947731 [Lentinula raphanica]|uniref:RING-type domain-containing protein n=1 Tax=Lentinula raphanica TaxID=153919 RepID=A0AA38PL36_9AGAR|nr:hypothetical protein F5878DRAFT_706066 [Lentinula raphanica]KAJ3973623.1 hypothetical protein EV361DRAFT_947731 [Lentinula raphanica]